jgi:hypothetical protein
MMWWRRRCIGRAMRCYCRMMYGGAGAALSVLLLHVLNAVCVNVCVCGEQLLSALTCFRRAQALGVEPYALSQDISFIALRRTTQHLHNRSCRPTLYTQTTFRTLIDYYTEYVLC